MKCCLTHRNQSHSEHTGVTNSTKERRMMRSAVPNEAEVELSPLLGV